VLALDRFGNAVIVDPAIAVADDLVAGRDHGARDIGIALERANDGKDAHRNLEAGKDAQQPPDATAAAILERRFDDRAAQPFIGRKANIGQHRL